MIKKCDVTLKPVHTFCTLISTFGQIWTETLEKGEDLPPAVPTYVVDEPLDLGLHAPVSELHLAQLVGTHDGGLRCILVDLLDPVVRQRPPPGFDRLVELGVFFRQVLVGEDVVLHDVYGVCDSEWGLGEKILICGREEETGGARDTMLTHCPLSLLGGGHGEDVALVPGVWFIVGLDVDGELLYKGTGVPKKPWKPDELTAVLKSDKLRKKAKKKNTDSQILS